MRRLSEYGFVAYFVERPTWEAQAEQYSDTVLEVQRIFQVAVTDFAMDCNKLKTTPTPNKNGSYSIKGGSYAIFWGPYAIFSVELPCF